MTSSSCITDSPAATEQGKLFAVQREGFSGTDLAIAPGAAWLVREFSL